MASGRRITMAAVLVVGLWGVTVHANVTYYEGTLSYLNGISGLTENNSNPWLAVGTELKYRVTDNQQGLYTYWYRLKVPAKGISHFTVEVSGNFTASNVIDVLQGNLAQGQPQTHHASSKANPGMKSDVFGIKFESTEALTWVMEFTSDRRPIWGDFYAVDGKKEGGVPAIWNSGFGGSDTDPAPDVYGPSAAITDHILVPDSTGSDDPPVVPVPGALLLAGIGVALAAGRKQRVS